MPVVSAARGAACLVAALALSACGTSADDAATGSAQPCDARTVAAGPAEPAFGESTTTKKGDPPTVSVRGRITVTASSACASDGWQLSLTPQGGSATDAVPLGGASPSGPFAAGEQLIFTIEWPGPLDPQRLTPAVLTINGAQIPVTVPGWNGGPLTWSGPEVQSNRTVRPTPFTGTPSPSGG